MKRIWIYLSNTFEVNTRGTKVTALSLFEDTYAKLSVAGVTDPVIQAILLDYEPACAGYREVYALKQSALGAYEGNTLNFETVLGEMPVQLRTWEGKVRAEYLEDSPDEHIIFPDKRTPFLNGTYESRINRVLSLSNTLAGYPILATTKTLVDTYYNRLYGARLVQQQKEGSSDTLSTLLENQRVLTSTELYGVLGLLMNHFRNNIERVSDFFDLTLLRSNTINVPTTLFKGQVTDDLTGLPIEGAVVRLPQIGEEATTNATGNFEITVEIGKHTVEVSAVGYLFYQQTEVEFIANENKVIDIALRH